MSRTARVASLSLAFAAALALPPRPAAGQEVPFPQPFTARSAVYVEAGGNALLYSVNYERMLVGGLGVRVGVGAIPVWFPWVEDDNGALVLIIPATATYLFGPGNHHLEVGLGVTYANASVDIGSWEGSEDGVFGTGTLGYRFQRPGGGFVFRAGLTPVFGGKGELEFFPMAGLSIGRSF